MRTSIADQNLGVDAVYTSEYYATLSRHVVDVAVDLLDEAESNELGDFVRKAGGGVCL